MRHMAVIHNILGKHNMHAGQPRILYCIDEMRGASQAEIAKALRISPASLATSVRRMEKAGLLTKSSNEQDLRVNTVQVTEYGHRMLKDSMHAAGESDKLLFQDFTPEEMKQVAGYLDRIYNNLSLLEEAANAD